MADDDDVTTPAPTTRPLRTIVGVAQGTPDLKNFVSAVRRAQMVNAFSGDDVFTVFAPTNNAFAGININKMDRQTLKEVLALHVTAGRLLQGDIVPGEKMGDLVVTVEGDDLMLTNINSDVKAKITKTNVLASNGVIHTIDKILLPATTSSSSTSSTSSTSTSTAEPSSGSKGGDSGSKGGDSGSKGGDSGSESSKGDADDDGDGGDSGSESSKGGDSGSKGGGAKGGGDDSSQSSSSKGDKRANNDDKDPAADTDGSSNSIIIAIAVIAAIIVLIAVVVGAVLVKRSRDAAGRSPGDVSFSNPMYDSQPGAAPRQGGGQGYMDVVPSPQDSEYHSTA